jgi:hypothetical protein
MRSKLSAGVINHYIHRFTWSGGHDSLGGSAKITINLAAWLWSHAHRGSMSN